MFNIEDIAYKKTTVYIKIEFYLNDERIGVGTYWVICLSDEVINLKERLIKNLKSMNIGECNYRFITAMTPNKINLKVDVSRLDTDVLLFHRISAEYFFNYISNLILTNVGERLHHMNIIQS